MASTPARRRVSTNSAACSSLSPTRGRPIWAKRDSSPALMPLNMFSRPLSTAFGSLITANRSNIPAMLGAVISKVGRALSNWAPMCRTLSPRPSPSPSALLPPKGREGMGKYSGRSMAAAPATCAESARSESRMRSSLPVPKKASMSKVALPSATVSPSGPRDGMSMVAVKSRGAPLLTSRPKLRPEPPLTKAVGAVISLRSKPTPRLKPAEAATSRGAAALRLMTSPKPASSSGRRSLRSRARSSWRAKTCSKSRSTSRAEFS